MANIYTVEKNNDHADWLNRRDTGIGGSDAPVIMGTSLSRSPRMLWLEKTGRVPRKDISDVACVRWGTLLESPIFDYVKSIHPEWRLTRRNWTYRSKARPWAIANIDGEIVDENGRHGVLEIKTTNAFAASDWESSVPDYYMPQPLHYLSVTGWDFMCVCVLIGGSDYREFIIERDETAIDEVVAAVDAFWQNNVQNDIEPTPTHLDVDSPDLHKGPDADESVLDLDADASESAHKLMRVKDEMDALTRERKRLTAELLAAMGDHTHACAHTSVGTTYNVTARYSNRKSVDYKAYAADHPGCFDDYTSTKRTFAGVTIS